MICEICGKDCQNLAVHIVKLHKDITTKEYFDRYLKKPGEGICPVCGKPTAFLGITDRYAKHCNMKCAQNDISTNQKRKDTALVRYGDANYRNVEKSRKTRERLYGKGIFNSPECVAKITFARNNATPEEKKIALEKSIKTRNERYGQWYNEKQGELSAITKMKNHGDPTYNNRPAAHKTCIDKYGFKCPAMSKEIQIKTKNTRYERYDGEYCSEETKKLMHKKMDERFNELTIKKYEDEIEFIDTSDRMNIKYRCKEKGHENVENYQLLYKRRRACMPLCTACYKKGVGSKGEHDLYEFICSLHNGAIKTDRTILNGYELDIYVPEKKLAIEFDGLYWHNELMKEQNYHLWKTEECEKQGIQLIHVFEDEWDYKQEIVKSRLKGLLGLNNRIYARKTECRTIDFKIAKEFLEDNHIQGSCVSAYNYGLFYNGELVSVMTFGKSRFKDGEFELLRFANKLYMNVIGGASKLFSHFIKDHSEIEKVVSYADRRWSKGNLYEKLGFKNTGKTHVNYYYVLKDGRHNRMEFQKHKLVAEGADPNKSEHEIMMDRGIYRIYDCGNLKYEWKRQK